MTVKRLRLEEEERQKNQPPPPVIEAPQPPTQPSGDQQPAAKKKRKPRRKKQAAAQQQPPPPPQPQPSPPPQRTTTTTDISQSFVLSDSEHINNIVNNVVSNAVVTNNILVNAVNNINTSFRLPHSKKLKAPDPIVIGPELAPLWPPSLSNGASKSKASRALDPEALDFIHRIYCRECQRMEDNKKCSASSSGETSPPSSSPQMSPNSPQGPTVEEHSLQQTMDQNKESLKRKLMMRRSVNELRDQGIYPPLKTPPAFAEQSKHLERAKTGDILRQKLQHRPDRQELVQHHILEDSTADPSLQERQRLLKKARLQDSLSNSLAHRPGPLELVEGNILCADSSLQDAIKEGKVLFSKTSQPDESNVFSFTSEEESDGALSPSVSDSSSSFAVATPSPSPAIPSPPDITPLLQKLQQHSAAPTSGAFSFATQVAPVFTSVASATKNTYNSATPGGKNLSRIKKSKPKSAPKSKIIKFHEYKGPPNKQLNPSSSASVPTAPSPSPESATPYNILLQQQQLFLQWQLDSQKKTVPFILPPQQTLFQQGTSSRPQTPASSPQPTIALAQVPVQAVRTLTPVPAASVPGSSQPSSVTVVTNQPFPVQASIISPQQPKGPATPVMAVSAPNVENICVKVTPAATANVKSPPVVSAQKKQIPTTHITAAIPAGFKIVKLEELKVADLKAELKKRNLTVSGPKPVLIERLKPHLGGDTLLVTTSPVAPPVKTEPSSQASRKIKTEGTTSPPMSPASPQAMDVASPASADPLSRPPSAVPMDVDALLDTKQKSPAAASAPRPPATPVASQPPKATTILKPFTPVQRQTPAASCKPQQTAIVKPQVQSPLPQAAVLTQASSAQSPVKVHIQAPAKPHIQVSSQSNSILVPQIQVRLPTTQADTTAPVGQPPVISHSELLNHQQIQIMELARQLQLSQKELKDKEQALTLKSQELADAQKKALAHQEHLKKHLTQAQANALATIASMPPGVQAEVTPLPINGAKTIATVTNTPLGMGPLRLVKTEDGSTCIIPEPPPLPQANVSAPERKVVHFSAPSDFVIKQEPGTVSALLTPSVSSPPAASVVCTTASVTKVSSMPANLNKSSPSLPASPAVVSSVSSPDAVSLLAASPGKLQKSSSSPFVTPQAMRDPPNYQEAIKNKQNLLMSIGDMNGESISLPNETNPLDPLTNALSMPSGLKSPTMDDVLDILIRSGELPADVAQDPLTVKTESNALHPPMTSVASDFPLDSLNSSDAQPAMLDMLSPIGSPMADGQINGMVSADLMDPAALGDFMNMDWTESDIHEGLMPQAPASASSSGQMDMNDWLDVIMPQNQTQQSTSDPILTPRPQDMLDLFNMDETDLYAPVEIMPFENAMETTSTTT